MNSIDWIIISKSLDGTLSDQESESLSEWLAESDEHRVLYQNIKNYNSYSLDENKYVKWKSEYGMVLSRLKRRQRKNKIRRRLILSTSAAAVFTFVMFMALFWNESAEMDAGKGTGRSKVQLQLANGRFLDIDAAQEDKLAEIAYINVSSGNKTLTYQRVDDSPRVEYNVLKTERGGEWNLVLEDGTKVFLNSSSTLKYPTVFAGKNRQVILEGEAYFEVTHNPDRPFIVKTSDMEILVRGTSFNVNAYSAQKTTRTTLVEGKIEVECSGHSHIVLPGQQIIFDKETQLAKIVEVDTELYASWRDGFYKFNDTRLEEILTTLSLWYDVDVIYTNEYVKDLRFTTSGKIARYDSLMGLLKKFEYTNNVMFELNGNKLTVRQK